MIYTYKCTECSTEQDAFRSVANRDDSPKCGCGGDTDRIITGGAGFTPVMGGADMPGYMCPVTDTYVTSRKQRREIIAQHGLVERG